MKYERMFAFLKECLAVRPRSTFVDLYKMLYQAEFGVGHIISSGEQALGFLEKEIESLDMNPVPGENLIEILSPDSGIVRINLRPFIGAGFDTKRLLENMLTTAEQHIGSPDRFKSMIELLAEIIPDLEVPVDVSGMDGLLLETGENKPGIVHHSDIYRKEYRPAYRVIMKVLVPGLTS